MDTIAVAAKINQVSDALHNAVAQMNAREYRNIRPTPASISTMTITCKLNVASVYPLDAELAVSMSDGPLEIALPKKRKRSHLEFYNQITMRHGKASIKVFKNGSMHLTGCKSMAQFVLVSSAVCAMLECVSDQAVRVTDFDVHMINVHFGVGKQLYLRGLRDLVCVEDKRYNAVYDPDVYPGLNVKIPVDGQYVTVLAFRSGKILVTGAKTAGQVQAAHAIITDIVDRLEDGPSASTRQCRRAMAQVEPLPRTDMWKHDRDAADTIGCLALAI